jgi:hypothetical protein
VPHSANIDCSSYPPKIEDYESPQRDKLNQLMGPDPSTFDATAARIAAAFAKGCGRNRAPPLVVPSRKNS